MYPKSTATSAKLGSSRYLICVATFAPSGAVADTGSHFSVIPKIRIRTIAVTNSGIAVSDRPVIVITRSVRRPRRRPESVPPRMLSGTTSTNATAASLSELASDGPRRSETGTWYWNDVPRSPRRKWLIQSQYWTTSGRSSASALLIRVDVLLAREVAEHVAPDVARQQLRGREHDHAQEPQRDQGEREPFQQEPGDDRPPSRRHRAAARCAAARDGRATLGRARCG